jgi:glyoxylase I family protein
MATCGYFSTATDTVPAPTPRRMPGFAIVDRARMLLRHVGTVTAEEDAGRLGFIGWSPLREVEGSGAMPGEIPTGEIHHLRLTVTDVGRSRQFYTSLLGFAVAVESPPEDDPSAAEVFKVLFGGVVMIRGNLLLGLRPMAPQGDRFDPDRVGLDHLSFGVASRDDLEQAVRLLEEHGVKHGEIASLPSFGIDVLSFEDPDGVQLELTAPMAQPAERT